MGLGSVGILLVKEQYRAAISRDKIADGLYYSNTEPKTCEYLSVFEHSHPDNTFPDHDQIARTLSKISHDLTYNVHEAREKKSRERLAEEAKIPGKIRFYVPETGTEICPTLSGNCSDRTQAYPRFIQRAEYYYLLPPQSLKGDFDGID